MLWDMTFSISMRRAAGCPSLRRILATRSSRDPRMFEMISWKPNPSISSRTLSESCSMRESPPTVKAEGMMGPNVW